MTLDEKIAASGRELALVAMLKVLFALALRADPATPRAAIRAAILNAIDIMAPPDESDATRKMRTAALEFADRVISAQPKAEEA